MWPSYQPCTAACKIAVSGVASPKFMALIAFSTISLSTEDCGSGNGGDGIGPRGPVMLDNLQRRSAAVDDPPGTGCGYPRGTTERGKIAGQAGQGLNACPVL